MPSSEKANVAVVGAGPVGLFAVSVCGDLGLSVILIDALPYVGGQCEALYPSKVIGRVPGFVESTARDVVLALKTQADSYSPRVVLNHFVKKFAILDNGFAIDVEDCCVHVDSVILATGCGSFSPQKPDIENLDTFENNVHYFVQDPQIFSDKKIVILGGGDSAVDWVLTLLSVAKSITLVHRKNSFRAHNCHKINELEQNGQIVVFRSSYLNKLCGFDDKLSSVEIASESGIITIETDELLIFFGMSTVANDWGVATKNQKMLVNSSTFETNIPGVYAIGDAVFYEGKLYLIASGFSEALTAVHAIKKKVSRIHDHVLL